MDNQVKELLVSYNKEFDINTQRAELLSRNDQFLEELNEYNEETFLGKLLPYKSLFQKGRKGNKVNVIRITQKGVETNDPDLSWPESLEKDKEFEELLKRNVEFWTLFCRRWNIMPEWDGDLKSLGKSMEPPVEFYWIEGKKDVAPALLMRINNWTTLRDLKAVWGQVEEFQNQVWKKQEKRTNFARDLLWYDLSKKHGFKTREIAKLWEELHPEEIDLLVVSEFRKKIAKEDFERRSLDGNQLLAEIKSGFLAAKYKRNFEYDRESYLTGGDPGRKVNPPFVDAVKKAIKRMDQQIAQVNESSMKKGLRIDMMLDIGKKLTYS